MTRDSLHALVDRIPDDQISAAQRILEYLSISPAYKAAWSAPTDEEPVTGGDSAAIVRGKEELRSGKVVRHEDILQEFGLT